MPTCDYCGEEIEFRYMGGRPTPIHLNGGWCSGLSGSSQSQSPKPFGSVVSYVNPNAYCPECGDRVFFYQSPFGGHVFFDDLGWPWPKHPCTDIPSVQKGKITEPKRAYLKAFFLTPQGQPLHVFRLTELSNLDGRVILKFNRVDQPSIAFRASISPESLKEQDITLKDLEHAPSFVVRFYDDHRLIEFISGRKRKIVSLVIPK